MEETEDLEERMGTENVAGSAMVEGQEPIDACEVARIATERLGTNELSIMLQGAVKDDVEQEPWMIAERLDILLFELMGKEEWTKRLDVMDGSLDIGMERLEIQQLSEALVSASTEIVSAQASMTQAEEIVEETRHRLDNILERLREAEKENEG